MQTLLQDLRFGLRTLGRERAFTAVAVLTLAIALGANSAIFTLVNAILLRPLPYAHPERIVKISNKDLKTGNVVGQHSYVNIHDLAKQAPSMEALSVHSQSGTFLTEGTDPELLLGTEIEAAGLPLLGVKPVAGRFFTAAEDRKGAPKVLLISYELWQRRFGGDPSIVGRTIRLTTRQEPWRVVGVMPQGFRFPANTEKVDYYSPINPYLSEEERTARDLVFLDAVGRLKAGATIEQFQTEADVVAQRLEKAYPDSNLGARFEVKSIHDATVGKIRPALLVLFAAVGVVLLIGCANVANLLLARASGRHKEISIRSAVGATRGRIIRQLLAESVLLSVVAGALGLLLASWGIDALVALAPPAIPRLDNVALDGGVLLFTVTLSVLTGVLFGLTPALSASKTNLTEALKEGSRGSTEGRRRNRTRNILVVGAIALSLVLLVGAGLLLRSFVRLTGIDPGFDYNNVAVVSLTARGAYDDDAKVGAFLTRVRQAFEAVPGVESVGGANILPLSGGQLVYSFEIVGRPPFPRGQGPSMTTVTVTPNYFKTMRIPLLRGRDVAETDTAKSPGVVVVNERFVRQFFPNEEPIGRKLKIGNGDDFEENEIVGVVGDVKYLELTEEMLPMFYLPAAQTKTRGLAFVARSAAATSLGPALRAAVRRLDAQQPITKMETLAEMRGETLAERKFSLALITALSSIALLLAGVGIYSIMSYSVTQRTSEIGIRMALGAEGRDIFRLIVGQAVRLVAIGLAAGVAVAFAATRIMSTLLYGVTPTDPVTFGAICVVIAVIALVASYIPASRATRVDPLVAIRYD